MRHTAVAASFLAISISGCVMNPVQPVTVGTLQEQCEKRTHDFPALVACTKDMVGADPRLSGERSIRFYLMTGDKLSEDVKAGTMKEIDARVAWETLYTDLKHKNQVAAQAAAAQQQAARQPSALPPQRPIEDPADAYRSVMPKQANTTTNCTVSNAGVIGQAVRCTSSTTQFPQ